MSSPLMDDGFDLETDEFGIYRDAEDLFNSLDSPDKDFPVDEYGIWHGDAGDKYYRQTADADTDTDTAHRTNRIAEDINNISELETSRSTSALGSEVIRATSATDAFDDLNLPELATGYCTSESDIRQADYQLYDCHEDLVKNNLVGSAKFLQHRNGDDDDEEEAAVREFEKLEIDMSGDSSESDLHSPGTARSQNTARSLTKLPAYIRRSSSSGRQSSDISPDRADDNFCRTYTVRQSKRSRKSSNERAVRDDRGLTESRIPILRSRSSSSSRPVSRNSRPASRSSRPASSNSRTSLVCDGQEVKQTSEAQSVNCYTELASKSSILPREEHFSPRNDNDVDINNIEMVCNSHTERVRSMSAGIPSDHQLFLLDEPSTNTSRRARRSYSLERSAKADQRQTEKKHRRQVTALMDLAGSSSMEDSEDGSASRDKLKARFLAEIKERKRHEETAKHLQQNYENLLRRHAEKELTIEQLRLGARVSLVCDPPTTNHIETGSVAKPQRAVVFNVSKQGRAVTGATLPQTGQFGLVNCGSDSPPNATLVGSVSNSGASLLSQKPGFGSMSVNSLSTMSSSTQLGSTSKSSLTHQDLDAFINQTSMSHSAGQVASVNSALSLSRSGKLNSETDGHNKSAHTSLSGDDTMSVSSGSLTLPTRDMDESTSLRKPGYFSPTEKKDDRLVSSVFEIQEQMNAFEILLDQDANLKVEEQQKVLASLQSSVSKLHQSALHNDRLEQNRDGENIELQLELVQLDTRLEQLKRRVEDNVGGQLSVHRNGPMRADHSIGQRGVGHMLHHGLDDDAVSDSVKECYELIERYQHLRPGNNSSMEASQLLANLKHAYEQTPDERKPVLPPAIEKQLYGHANQTSSPSLHFNTNQELASSRGRNPSSLVSDSDGSDDSQRGRLLNAKRLSTSETSASELRQSWRNDVAKNTSHSNVSPASNASLSNASSSSIDSQKTRSRSRHLPPTSQSQLNATAAAADTRQLDHHRQRSGQRGNSHVDGVHASAAKHQDSKGSFSGRGNGLGGSLKDEIDSGYVGSTRSHVTNQYNPSRQESQRTKLQSVRNSIHSSASTPTDQIYSSTCSETGSDDTVEERKQTNNKDLAGNGKHRVNTSANTNKGNTLNNENEQATNLLRNPLVVQPIPLQPVHYQTFPLNSIPAGIAVQPIQYSGSAQPGHYTTNYPMTSAPVLLQPSAVNRLVQPHASYEQSHYIDSYQFPATSHWTDYPRPSKDGGRRNDERHHANGNDTNGRRWQPPVDLLSERFHEVRGNNNNDAPIPSLYFEPTRSGLESQSWTHGRPEVPAGYGSTWNQPVPKVQDYNSNFRGHTGYGGGTLDPQTWNQSVPGVQGYRPTGTQDVFEGASRYSSMPTSHSQGIQNVPLMSSTGVQYAADNGGTIWQTPTDGSNQQPVFITGRACPLCGASHYHAHVDSIPTHHGLSTVHPVPGVPVMGQSSVEASRATGMPVVLPGSSMLFTASPQHTTANQVQRSVNGHPKVRYYIREYGKVTSPSDGPHKLHYNKKHSQRSDYSFKQDDDDDDDLDSSLTEAVATAKHLRRLSMHMKSSLHQELSSHSHRNQYLIDNY